MEYRRTVIYRIRGITLGASPPEHLVVNDPANRVRAFLTERVDEHSLESDRSTALANMTLDIGFRGAPGQGPCDERLAAYISDVQELRRTQFGRGPYLVVQVEGEIQGVAAVAEIECADFVYRHDGVSKDEIRARTETHVRTILAGLALAAEEVLAADKVSDAIVFYRADGKPVYSYTTRLSASAYVSSPLRQESADAIQRWYEALGRQQEFESVPRLLVSSLEAEADALRAFVAAWAGLEIFVNKTFGQYERQVFQELGEGERPGGGVGTSRAYGVS